MTIIIIAVADATNYDKCILLFNCRRKLIPPIVITMSQELPLKKRIGD
jgi:hypothetical protein